MPTFCYWTVADGDHGKMATVDVDSARKCGVKNDFHIWTDLDAIEGATVHPCGQVISFSSTGSHSINCSTTLTGGSSYLVSICQTSGGMGASWEANASWEITGVDNC